MDEVIRLWDLRTGHLLERFESHEKSVYSVAFSPNGNSIVSGSLDKKIRIWDLSPATLAVLAGPPSEAKPTVTINKTSRCLFSGHADYVLTVGYPSSSSSLGKVDPAGNPIPGDLGIDWVFSGGKDRFVMFWDANSDEGTPLISMIGHKNSGIFNFN